MQPAVVSDGELLSKWLLPHQYLARCSVAQANDVDAALWRCDAKTIAPRCIAFYTAVLKNGSAEHLYKDLGNLHRQRLRCATLKPVLV